MGNDKRASVHPVRPSGQVNFKFTGGDQPSHIQNLRELQKWEEYERYEA